MAEREDKPVNQTELPLEASAGAKEVSAEPDEGEVVEWTCHPMRRRPWVTIAVTLFIIVMGLVVYFATFSNAFTVLTLVILYASLAKFYFPTRYRMSERGIQVKTMTQTLVKNWSMYRSFYPDKNGVLLSPFTRPTRLENFRGLYVMYDKNRDEVVEFVRRYVGKKAVKTQDEKKENADSGAKAGERS